MAPGKLSRRTSVIAAVLFGGLALFEAALAAGVPWGRAAWGGGQAELGAGLPISSAVSVVLWSLAALVVLRRGGHTTWSPLPDRWLRVAVWVLAGYSILGVLVNLASRSSIERALMAPFSLALATCCAIVALWGTVPQRA